VTAPADRTIEVLTGKIAMNKSDDQRRVHFSFAPVGEKGNLARSTRHGRYKDGQMVNRRGLAVFTEKVKGVVGDRKVAAVKGYVRYATATVVIDRSVAGGGDSKNLAMTLTFANDASAQAVKAALVKHLVAEIKKPENKANAASMQNPKVVCVGSIVTLHVPLETEKDQMHAFGIMATFVARNILATTQPTVVKRLKFLADHQARLGRDLEKSVQAELSRTSFFSLARKTSLMYTTMKIRTNIRRAENVYVDLKKDPKVIAENVQKLADISAANIDEVNKFAESIQKSAAGKNQAAFAQTGAALQI
jgi:hypothetical protein